MDAGIMSTASEDACIENTAIYYDLLKENENPTAFFKLHVCDFMRLLSH